MQQRLICVLGLIVFIAVAWLISSNRKRFPWRIVIGGLGLQFALGFLVLRTKRGQRVFEVIGNVITAAMDSVDVGSKFMFESGTGDVAFNQSIMMTFAFKVLPTVIFFSALMSILYYLRVMQWVVWALAWVMQFTLKTSGPETLAAAANVFVGHTEAPLVVRPYLAKMTRSELNAMMTGGFATVTGSLLAVYVDLGISLSHLLTASVISAPAALLIAKVMLPEEAGAVVSASLSMKDSDPAVLEKGEASSESSDEGSQGGPDRPVNVIAAAVNGASDGLKLALNVGAMLIAFLAILALIDTLLLHGCQQLDWMNGPDQPMLSLGIILGYGCWPIAWLLGIPAAECAEAGRLIGFKTVANEFIAFMSLGEMMNSPNPALSERTAMVLTYALAGFSNFGAIGIQVGGIGGLEPKRKRDLAELGLRAMFGGLLACCMTGAVAGVLY